MLGITVKYLVCISLFTLAACASVRDLANTSVMTEDQWAAVLPRARAVALQSGMVRESERSIIETSNPHVSYYFLSGIHYAQYFITWEFSDQEAVTVSGQGDMLSLEGAEVNRRPKKAPESEIQPNKPLEPIR